MSDTKYSEMGERILHVESTDKTKDVIANNVTSSLQLKAPIAGVSDMTEHNESCSTSCQELNLLNGIQQMPRQILR
jgi:hypothetical protein